MSHNSSREKMTHQVSQHHLLLGHLGNPLLHRVSRHKPVDHDSVCLTNPVSSAKCLQQLHNTTKFIDE